MGKENNPEQTGEQLVKQLATRVGELSTSLKTATETIQSLQKADEGLKGLNLDKLVEQYEETRSAVESIQEAMKKRQNGLWFPGVEDVGKKFNLLRLCAGVKYNKVEEFAPFEFEVVTEARKALEKAAHPAMKAGHVMWDDVSGGLWVPDQVIADVIAPIYTQSVFVSLLPEAGTTGVTVIDGLTGNPVKIPEFAGGMIAYWIGEEDDYVESKTRSGNLTLTPKKLGVLTRITAEMMQFSSPAFDAFMRRDMIRAAAKKLDYTIAYGTGSANMPIGIYNHAKIQRFSAATSADAGVPEDFTMGAGAEATFDTLMECDGAMEDDDVQLDGTAKTVCHPRFARRLKKLKIDNYSAQTTNRAYLLGAPFISDERLTSIIGPVSKSTQIPTTKANNAAAAKYTDVFRGNLGEFVFGRWGGIQVMDDGGTGDGFIRDQTYIKMRMWGDTECRQPRALRVIPDAQARD